jgi:hypothetical protein
MGTYTINFPVEKINENDPDGEDTIQVIMEFTDSSGDTAVNASDIGCVITKYGKLEQKYSFEDAFMVPGTFNLEIGDSLGTLDSIFFAPGAAGSTITDKQGKVTVKINGTTKFVGHCLEDTIHSDTSGKKISFTAAPKTDLINKRMVYDSSGEDGVFSITAATHSSGVVTITFSIPHSFAVGKRILISSVVGMTDINASFRVQSIPQEDQVTISKTTAQTYTSGGSATQVETLNPFEYEQSTLETVVFHPIYEILRDIYRLVNPAIDYPATLTVINDWQFKGVRILDPDDEPCWLNNIVFTDLSQEANRLYFNNSYGISNCGDVLRHLALDWASFTGLISYEQAFFKRLFQYDPSNLQTVNVYHWEKGYRYGLIDYITVNTEDGVIAEPYHEGIFTEMEDRALNLNSLTAYYTLTSPGGTVYADITRTDHYVFTSLSNINQVEGDIYSNNGSQFTVVGTPLAETVDKTRITCERTSGTNEPDATGTLTRVSGTGDVSITYNAVGSADGVYQIYQARDPVLFSNEFKDHGALLARVWWNFRGNMNNGRVDKFIFKGVDYDFLKDFNYNGLKFQPIAMTFDYAKGTTECEAIYLGEV